jgi:U6 snRNA-associated Sm-like protein LSm6
MADAPPQKRAPGDFLRSIVGRPVSVHLQSGAEYRGVLVCLDGFMNIALEQAEEYSDGSLRSKLGDCFLRGNNGARSLFARPREDVDSWWPMSSLPFPHHLPSLIYCEPKKKFVRTMCRFARELLRDSGYVETRTCAHTCVAPSIVCKEPKS